MKKKEFIYTCNDKCKQVLEKYAIDFKIRKNLPIKLKRIIGEGFERKDDCLFFKKFAAPFSKDLADKTGNEGFSNLLYINDYVRSDISTKSLLMDGLSFMNKLSDELYVIDNRFMIIGIIEKDDLTVNSDRYYFKVTFHIYREKDVPYYNVSEIKDVGILKISLWPEKS